MSLLPAERPHWLRLLAPSGLCQVCQTWQRQPICAECIALFGAPRLRCARCALALPAGVAAHVGARFDSLSADLPLCADCRRESPPQIAAVAAFDYVHPWSGLLGRLKFHDAVELARPLAQALAAAVAARQAADQRLPAADLVLPVPLAQGRLRERGYNQAWELARRVARRLGVRAEAALLERLRETPHQLVLPRVARHANVRAAFVLAPGAARHLTGRQLAVVDDVMTTGATLAEVGRTLLRGGAASVQCWVVARTPLDDDPQ
ncbi:MAG: hypothetical protein RIQ60_512 [Pseudomonadota bacterium]|jgi:ComF family protein